MFEWAIPEEYVLHKISLQTLMERDFLEPWFEQPFTGEVRSHIARELQGEFPWEIGLTLGFFARRFGARAPLNWVSHQIFDDCVRSKIKDDNLIRLDYAHDDTEIVAFQFFDDLDDGIDTSLNEWWLTDTDFVLDLEEFYEWREVMEDGMISDLIDFWETWHDVGHDGTIGKLSARDQLSYDQEKNKRLLRHEETRAVVEAEAVRIGL